MIAIIKKFDYIIPITMLAGTLISNFVILDYTLVGNILGYSILSNIILYLYFNNRRYCWLTRNTPTALLFINIIDIIGVYIPQIIYSNIYNISVCSSVLILSLIFEIKKRSHK